MTNNAVAAAAETGLCSPIEHFFCNFRSEMCEGSGENGPYMSEYEGEIMVGLEGDGDGFHLAGDYRRNYCEFSDLGLVTRFHYLKRSQPWCAGT